MRLHKVFAYLLVTGIFLSILACDLVDYFVQAEGSLILNIESDDIDTKTLAPALTLSVSTYEISGSGPKGTASCLLLYWLDRYSVLKRYYRVSYPVPECTYIPSENLS